MAHEVFISYASDDKAVADATCAALEADGIRCWIAPRDVMGKWGPSITEAIESSRCMVLILSAQSNVSGNVEDEIASAATNKLAIIPLRIEAVTPSKNIALWLKKHHWLDAMTPPLKRHLKTLAKAVALILELGIDVEANEPTQQELIATSSQGSAIGTAADETKRLMLNCRVETKVHPHGWSYELYWINPYWLRKTEEGVYYVPEHPEMKLQENGGIEKKGLLTLVYGMVPLKDKTVMSAKENKRWLVLWPDGSFESTKPCRLEDAYLFQD